MTVQGPLCTVACQSRSCKPHFVYTEVAASVIAEHEHAYGIRTWPPLSTSICLLDLRILAHECAQLAYSWPVLVAARSSGEEAPLRLAMHAGIDDRYKHRVDPISESCRRVCTLPSASQEEEFLVVLDPTHIASASCRDTTRSSACSPVAQTRILQAATLAMAHVLAKVSLAASIQDRYVTTTPTTPALLTLPPIHKIISRADTEHPVPLHI